MNKLNQMSAISILRDEFDRYDGDGEDGDILADIGCSVDLIDDNLFTWNSTYIGPDDTGYHGGFFVLKITIPSNYPNSPPTVNFETKIFHPNIDESNGRVCINLLDYGIWNSSKRIIDILLAIYYLLINPNPYSPLNTTAAELYKKSDKSEYFKKCNEYVRKYAAPN